MIDSSVGEAYAGDVCDDCSEKVRLETEKLKKRHLMFPRRVAKRFQKLLCSGCRRRIKNKLLKQRRGKK